MRPTSEHVMDEERRDWMGRGWACPIDVDASTGGIATAAYEQDIVQSIRIILCTAPGERVMRPDFGCGVHDLAFDVIDTALLTRLEGAVRDALARYEARVEVMGVQADPLRAAEGLLRVAITYRVRRTNQTGNLVWPFYFREGGIGLQEGSRT